MRVSARLFVSIILADLVALTLAGQSGASSRILSARSVYFDNQLGAGAVGDRALVQLKKWGRFQIVQDREQSDLTIVLSADSYKGDRVVFSGGQTGTIDNGNINEDRVPNYNKQAPVRYAYLTVIDSKTGEKLWSDSHRWGGLLTGFNSVGDRLVKELEKETRK